MKTMIVVLILIVLVTPLFSKNRAEIFLVDGDSFYGSLLYATDSLIYVWTGFREFNEEKLQYAIALEYSKVSKIDLNRSISWKRGIIKALPITLAGSATVLALNFKEQNLIDILGFGTFFNIVFSVPLGGIISITSHFKSDIVQPTPELFDPESGKHRDQL